MEWLKETADLASANASEEDKMAAMMHQATKAYDPSNYVMPKGPKPPEGVPGPGYVCHNCNTPGHYINQCPKKRVAHGPRAKRSAGIPFSFLTPVEDSSEPGALLLQSGQYAVPKLTAAAYKEKKKELPPFVPQKLQAPKKEKETPSSLLCPICKQPMTDAVIIVCCGASFCDECIRDALLESETHTCCECGQQNQSPDRLVPNLRARYCVVKFLNGKGYGNVQDKSSHSKATATVISKDDKKATHETRPLPSATNVLTAPLTPTCIPACSATRIKPASRSLPQSPSPQPIPTITGVCPLKSNSVDSDVSCWSDPCYQTPHWNTTPYVQPNTNDFVHSPWGNPYSSYPNYAPAESASASNHGVAHNDFYPCSRDDYKSKKDHPKPRPPIRPPNRLARSRSNSPITDGSSSRSRSRSPIHCTTQRRKDFTREISDLCKETGTPPRVTEKQIVEKNKENDRGARNRMH